MSYDDADRWQRLQLTDVRAELERRVRVLRAKTRRPVSVAGAYLDQLVLNLYGGPGETVVYVDELSVSPVPADEAAPAVEAATPTPKAESSDTPPDEGLSAPPKEPEANAALRIKLDRNRLFKDGMPWVFSAIRAPGANIDALLKHGFDVLSVSLEADSRAVNEAAKRGILLMPTLDARSGSTPGEPADLASAAAAYAARDAVAFWNLGENLGASTDPAARNAERERVRALVSALREQPAGVPRLTTGVVAGLFPDYSRPPQNLDMIGVHPIVWGTTMELSHYQHYLEQRRNLSFKNPEAFFWTWITATPPEEVHQAVWGFDVPPAWGIARVQPEQVRLCAYAALAAGYRGLGFKSDAELTRASGRAMLIELALLNAELDLFESIIAGGFDPIPLIPTFPPDPPLVIVYTSPGTMGSRNQPGAAGATSLKQMAKIRPEMKPHPSISAAVISTLDKRSKLLLVADLSAGAQWQPPQMAINDLKIRVQGAADNAQAYEVNLGTVKLLDRERMPGGLQLSLPDFGTTALILLTTDQELVAKIEGAVASVRSLAIKLAIEQARLQYQWVTEINGRLAADGHKIPDAADLLEAADKSIKSAEEALARAASTYEDYGLAWSEARRAGHPLRLLMRTHFEVALNALNAAAVPVEERNAPPPPALRPISAAAKKRNAEPRPKPKPARLLSPVSSPALLAFNTLPQHYLWVSWIRDAKFGPNLLQSGAFEDASELQSGGWMEESYPTDGVEGSITSVEGGPGSSQRALKLRVAPREPAAIDELPPYLDHPAAALRSPAVQVGAQQLFRISLKIKMSRAMPPGAGGLIVRDSLGGAPLEFRTLGPIPDWQELILYRRAPADGALTVTLGLAGYGEAFFDDLKVERVFPKEAGLAETPALERRPSPLRLPPRAPTARAPSPRTTR